MMSSDEIYSNSENMDSPHTIFLILVVISQIFGTAMVLLWMGNFQNGYGWDIKTVFNYHPVFMTIGLILFYGNAILVYRLFKNVTKIYIKVLHVILHAGALIFASIALKAVFDSHNLKTPPIPNFYSTHSWIGIITFSLFVWQWILGFITFLFPKLSENIRRWYLPHHKFWGIAVFCMSCATALMGITEKFIFSVKDYSKLPNEMVLVNFFGLSIVIYGTLVVYLVTKFDYARKND